MTVRPPFLSKFSVIFSTVFSFSAFLGMLAAGFFISPATAAAAAEKLSLREYLEQVKTRNPEARAYAQQAAAAEWRLPEADSVFLPELYAAYDFRDAKLDTASNFAPSRTEERFWRLGLRQQFSFGLQSDLYFSSQRQILTGAPTLAYKFTDYMDSMAVLELRQSLWANGFGSATRAESAASRADLRAERLRAQFSLRSLLLQAEDLYWSLAAANRVVRLQKDNVARAARLHELMRKKFARRLVDDVDVLQARALETSRQLELQQAQDERALIVRQLNTLRGQNGAPIADAAENAAGNATNNGSTADRDNIAATSETDLETTEDLPPPTAITQKVGALAITREDFQAMMEQATSLEMRSRASISRIRPQLDLVANLGANGIDSDTPEAYEETGRIKHPFWSVGVQFSIVLDFADLRSISRGHQANERAARELTRHAEFSLDRTYRDLRSRHGEAYGRYEKALGLENVQADLVERERRRLLNGRTTTLQMITAEQNLATAQIQRVRAQLAVLQIHNVLKSFEESL